MAIQDLDYLKTRFEKGDFPDQNDFHDLLDSCYNFSLSDGPDFYSFLASASGNWEQTYHIVDAKRYEWDEAYTRSTFFKNVSSSFATKSGLTNNYLNLTGGVLAGNLGVQGRILSGSSDLYNLFLTPNNGFQQLSYDKNTSALSITPGNTISLSSIKSFAIVTFTHNSFNPEPNKTYNFGQLGQIPPLTATSNSSVYRSLFSGQIKNLTIQNSYSSGSDERHIISLHNRTKNLSSLLVDNIVYTDSTVNDGTVITTSLFSFPPSNWTTNAVEGAPIGEGLRFISNGSSIQSTTLTGTTEYKSLSMYFESKKDAGGTSQFNINFYNTNNVTVANTVTVTNDPSFSLKSFVVNLPTSTDTLKINIALQGTQASLKNFFLFGQYNVDTKLTNVSLNPALPVSENDLLEIRLKTPASYVIAPTNVVNFINAKFEIIN